MLQFLRTNAEHPDFVALVKRLDLDLAIRDGDDHAFYAQFNKTGAIRHAVLAYENGQAIGCGAFKAFDGQIAEIKRVFVDPDYRGKGVGFSIVNELERWAAALNYPECILETGKNQPEAIRLYQKAGYTITKNYGPYEHIENSVCMKKTLAGR